MSQIHQMQIRFVPLEDRLLFRLNTQGRTRAEFRFWLTRRYVKALWAAVLKMLYQRKEMERKKKAAEGGAEGAGEVPRPKPAPSIANKAIELTVDHQQAVSKADFKTEFQESHLYPLGEEPILVSKIAVKDNPEKGQMLCMHPDNGQGLELNLEDHMLHSFCKLLVDAAVKADWGLNLDFGEASGLISRGGLN